MATDQDAWARGLVGKVLNGRYRLDRLLGMGGMGAVFAGEHVAVGRRVAVKMLLPELAADENTTRRFHQEARAAAAVARRGVVDILDYDQDPQCGPYLVMEHLGGEPLSGRIERKQRLEPGELLWIAESILRTLAAVHAQGIVHRDLKPDNVFVAQDEGEEVVKILDFGISRVMSNEPATESALLTRPGVVLGTPTYMAPEQARAEPSVDHRADLYAVGAILFECASGRPPHQGQNWQQVFALVLTSPPPPLRGLRPGLPDPLYEIIDRALARDPDARYQSAEAMLQELRRISAPLPPTRSPGGADASFPQTRAHEVTPMGNAWQPSTGGAVGPPSEPSAASTPGTGTPYAVASQAEAPRKGRGMMWIAVIGVVGFLLAAAGVGGGLYYASQQRQSGGSTSDVVVVQHDAIDAGAGGDVAVVDAPKDGGAPESDADAGGETQVASAGGSGSAGSAGSSGSGRRGSGSTRGGSRGSSMGGSGSSGSSGSSGPSGSSGAAAGSAGGSGGGGSSGSAGGSGSAGSSGSSGSSGGGNVAATLQRRLEAAQAHRRAGRHRQAKEGFEDVVAMAWTAQVPSGSPAARVAAEARIAVGDMHAARVRRLPQADTPEEFSQGWQRVTNAYSQAAQEYGRVAMYGHTDMTQCGLVRSGRSAEQLAEVAKNIQAPRSIADLGQEQADNFAQGFRDSASSYLEVAKSLYEAAMNMPGNSACRTQAMDGMQRVLRQLGRRAP